MVDVTLKVGQAPHNNNKSRGATHASVAAAAAPWSIPHAPQNAESRSYAGPGDRIATERSTRSASAPQSSGQSSMYIYASRRKRRLRFPSW